MGFIKNIARKILHDEIEQLKKNVEEAESRTAKLLKELDGLDAKHETALFEEKKQKDEALQQKSEADCKAEELEKENQILRKYYDLDKEPSDEIKIKIHIDLEVNRLKEENLKLHAICNRQPVCIPQPYPVYAPGFGRGFI